MTVEKIILPDQFYVGYSDCQDPPLAFLVPNGSDAAAKKRIATVDKWVVSKTSRWDATAQKYIKQVNRQSEVLENKLLDGYTISQSIRRIHWGGGNVVWRVIDPRGFEFEISSANFARIVDCTTIVNGVIQGKCIIGRTGSTNVLLPELSQPYQDALKFTDAKKSTVINKKNIPIGSKITLNDTTEAIYFGKVFVMLREKLQDQYDAKSLNEEAYKLSVKEWYAYLQDDIIFLRKDIKPISVGNVEMDTVVIDQYLSNHKNKDHVMWVRCTTVYSNEIIALRRNAPKKFVTEVQELQMTHEEALKFEEQHKRVLLLANIKGFQCNTWSLKSETTRLELTTNRRETTFHRVAYAKDSFKFLYKRNQPWNDYWSYQTIDVTLAEIKAARYDALAYNIDDTIVYNSR